jgi:protein-L-isoaspartate(D-aspartate) O-methyltransferase
MAQMMGTTGRVIGIDHVKELIDRSEENLKKNFPHLSNKVKFVKKDGRNGYLFGSIYDVINIGGAVTEIPKRVLDQLKTGGRLIAPVGPVDDTQELVTIDKLEDGSFKRVVHLSVSFGSLKSLEEQLRK